MTASNDAFNPKAVAAKVREQGMSPQHAARALVNKLATARFFPPPWEGVDDVGFPTPGSVEAIGEMHQLLLGKQSEKRGEQGSYYTPDPLADFMARFTAEILENRMSEVHPLSQVVVDPACGAGILLVRKARELTGRLIDLERKTIEEFLGIGGSREIIIQGLLPLIAPSLLFGLDIDPVAVDLTKSNLWLNTNALQPISWMDRNIVVGNVLDGDQPPALIDLYGGSPPPIVT